MSKQPRRSAAGNNEPAGKPDVPDNGGTDSTVSLVIEGEPATTNPAAAAADAGDTIGEPVSRPRRGRPPGSGAGKTTKPIPLNVNGLEKLLVGIHAGVAFWSGRMEIALDTTDKSFDGMTEAEFLAKSIKDVADHYGRGLLDQKTLDWLNLTQCLAMVYGGRIFAIRSAPREKPAPSAPRAEAVRSGPPPKMHQPEPLSQDIRTGEIPGIGPVVFPHDHPLTRKDN